MRMMVASLLLLLTFAAAGRLAAQNVEARGITPSIKIEEAIYGHLKELNGKYKMRVTEVIFAPGALLRR